MHSFETLELIMDKNQQTPNGVSILNLYYLNNSKTQNICKGYKSITSTHTHTQKVAPDLMVGDRAIYLHYLWVKFCFFPSTLKIKLLKNKDK